MSPMLLALHLFLAVLDLFLILNLAGNLILLQNPEQCKWLCGMVRFVLTLLSVAGYSSTASPARYPPFAAGSNPSTPLRPSHPSMASGPQSLGVRGLTPLRPQYMSSPATPSNFGALRGPTPLSSAGSSLQRPGNASMAARAPVSVQLPGTTRPALQQPSHPNDLAVRTSILQFVSIISFFLLFPLFFDLTLADCAVVHGDAETTLRQAAVPDTTARGAFI